MRPYLRVFYCAVLIYVISIAIDLYTRPRKLEIENLILSSAEFKLSDLNNDGNMNFYSISDDIASHVYKKLNHNDIKILSSIIKGEERYWAPGPINYKLESVITSILGTSDNFFVKINDSAKLAIHDLSFLLLKRFGLDGFEEIININFYNQDPVARDIILEVLDDPRSNQQEISLFKKRLIAELEESEDFIEEFYNKYCANFKEECMSANEVFSLKIDNLVKENSLEMINLQFDRYNDSNLVKNFENSRAFIHVFPELKDRLCANEKANLLRPKEYIQSYQESCSIP